MTGALERPYFANLMDRWLYRQGTTMAAGFQRALVAFVEVSGKRSLRNDNGYRAQNLTSAPSKHSSGRY